MNANATNAPQKKREMHNHHMDSTIWNDFDFRDDDIVARIGGDEFAAAIVEKNNSNTSRTIAKRILKEHEAPILIDGIYIPVTMSIGIAKYPADGENMEDTLKKADKALYAVKKKGRNNFAFYKPTT